MSAVADDAPAPDRLQPTARLLTACQVPERLAGPAVAVLGATADQQLRADPWRLLLLPQIRPDQADWFARRMLGAEAGPQDPRRGRALTGYLLRRAARDGHTAVPAGVIAAALARLRIADPAQAVEAAVDEGAVLPFEAPDSEAEAGVLLALARYAMAEEAVAEGVQRLTALAGPVPGAADALVGDEDNPIDEAQQDAVRAAAGHGVTVLCGGPGTGKSRTIAAVAAMAAGCGLRLALAAPTGRAARRLAELAGAPASTVHRLLGAQGGEGRWVFTRTEEEPLDADLVVVDEASMLDAELAAALVEACADGTRLLLVGDPAQLPSIGPGRVLADLIDSGAVPVTELARLYRQRRGGVIARMATAVRGGQLPPVESADREVVVVPVTSSQSACHRVLQLVTDSIPRALGIQPADIQVITPVHQGAAGTVELNRALKERLNPGPGEHAGFDPGDRVVAVANHPAEGFSNGETGTVTGPGDGGLVIEFPAGAVCVPHRLLAGVRHGWALTVHRAQGSEWPAVVAVFPAEATGMLSRPLAYTAITRAQRHLSVVHGTGPALAAAVAEIGEQPRVTRLASLLT
ncbi:MAG TPA: AAA family ATPase [Streptosporangiaceae bacterium]|nr:AAA family ATPase [Streptosporangiaceae bacterium]